MWIQVSGGGARAQMGRCRARHVPVLAPRCRQILRSPGGVGFPVPPGSRQPPARTRGLVVARRSAWFDTHDISRRQRAGRSPQEDETPTVDVTRPSCRLVPAHAPADGQADDAVRVTIVVRRRQTSLKAQRPLTRSDGCRRDEGLSDRRSRELEPADHRTGHRTERVGGGRGHATGVGNRAASAAKVNAIGDRAPRREPRRAARPDRPGRRPHQAGSTRRRRGPRRRIGPPPTAG